MTRIGSFWSVPWVEGDEPVWKSACGYDGTRLNAHFRLSPQEHSLALQRAGIDVHIPQHHEPIPLSRVIVTWGQVEAVVYFADDDDRGRRALNTFSRAAVILEVLANVAKGAVAHERA